MLQSTWDENVISVKQLELDKHVGDVGKSQGTFAHRHTVSVEYEMSSCVPKRLGYGQYVPDKLRREHKND